MSKCGKIISDTLGYASCATFLFLPHFDVICDLSLNRRTATWNLFVNYRWRHRTARGVGVMIARAKTIYIFVIKVNKSFSFLSSRCFLKEVENVYSVFLSSYRNTAHDFYFLNVNCTATTEQLPFCIRFTWHSPTQIFQKSNPKNVRSVLVCMQVGYVIMKRTFNYSLGTTMEKENLKYSDFAFGTNFLIYQRIYHFTLHFKPIYGNENFQKISI